MGYLLALYVASAPFQPHRNWIKYELTAHAYMLKKIFIAWLYIRILICFYFTTNGVVKIRTRQRLQWHHEIECLKRGVGPTCLISVAPSTSFKVTQQRSKVPYVLSSSARNTRGESKPLHNSLQPSKEYWECLPRGFKPSSKYNPQMFLKTFQCERKHPWFLTVFWQTSQIFK